MISMEELTGLPEREACHRYLGAVNHARFRWLVLALSVGAFAALIYNLFEGQWLATLPSLLVLAAARWSFHGDEQLFDRRSFDV